MNIVALVGRIGKNRTQKGEANYLSLAVQDDYPNKETGEYEVQFFDIVIFAKTEKYQTYLDEHITQGTQVAVRGKLSNKRYTDKETGETKYPPLQIIVDQIDMLGKPKEQA